MVILEAGMVGVEGGGRGAVREVDVIMGSNTLSWGTYRQVQPLLPVPPQSCEVK